MSDLFLGIFIGFLAGWGLEFFRMQFKIQSSLDDLERLKAQIRRDKTMGRLG